MELFFSDSISSDTLILTEEDSLHCARVLRHKVGDDICVVDGKGTMYECRITSLGADSGGKGGRNAVVEADITERHHGWNSHPYRLAMAVCPTKNTDRYEWFIEKATEIGVDSICPVFGERSERRVYKTDRAGKIVLSAVKQSLKSSAPKVEAPVSVAEFIRSAREGLKFIAYCFEDENVSRSNLQEALQSALAGMMPDSESDTMPDITVLIGPEGDFSPHEASLALQSGYIPIHLGNSRLRTETAAVVAVTMIYSFFASLCA